MPNTKDQKKKAGRNKGKKNKAMREAIKERKAVSRAPKPTHDEPDRQPYKPESTSDRTRAKETTRRSF